MTISVSAIQLWSTRDHTPDQNREHALWMLRTALSGQVGGSQSVRGEASPSADVDPTSDPASPLAMPGRAFRSPPSPLDLAVLPEAVSMLCYPDGRPDFTYRNVAEPVPGPTTDRVCQMAAEAGTNVVIGLVADRGPDSPCQNVAVVIDRSGSIVGMYEKTHEPEICQREQDAGLGKSVAVFDLDFGRIGIFICWDLMAPEIPQILADAGADLLCFPHLISLPTKRNFAVSLRARAIDTGLPVVAAGMRDAHNHNGSQDGLYPTCILDGHGVILAQSEVAGADVISATLRVGAVDPEVNRRRGTRRPGLYAASYAEIEARRRGVAPSSSKADVNRSR